MRRTERLGIPQWDPEDPIARQDLNEIGRTLEEKMLSAETVAMLGLPDTTTPDAMFQTLILSGGKYAFKLAVHYANGQPCADAAISGVTGLTGEAMKTGNDGTVLCYTNAVPKDITITPPYIDIAAVTQKLTSSEPLKQVAITVPLTEGRRLTITSARDCQLSPFVRSVDICCVGGGGGGGGFVATPGSGDYDGVSGGGGGGGGYASNLLNHSPTPPRVLRTLIGSGGTDTSAPSSGGAGGTTSVSTNEVLIASANGGGGGKYTYAYASNAGGAGNGMGGPSFNMGAQAASIYIFNEVALGLAGGGGGGGAWINGRSDAGAPFGGQGPYWRDGTIYANTFPTGFGGGGGGGGMRRDSSPTNVISYASTRGYSGCIYLRFHY